MDIDIKKFKKDGYLNIGRVLNNDELKNLKYIVTKNLNYKNNEKKFKASKNLILINKNFYSLLVNSKILNAVKILCNNKNIFFTPHTDVHINLGAGRVHRDNRNSDRVFGRGNDWDETKQNYNVFRIAVYLTSYQESKTSLVVFPGTHRNDNFYQNFWFKFFNTVVYMIRSLFSEYQFHQYAPFIKKKILKVNSGDCVIFDKRIRHAGGKILRKSDKMSIFFSYGEANNIHTINDFNYIKSHNYETNYPKDLQSIFKKNNIQFKL